MRPARHATSRSRRSANATRTRSRRSKTGCSAHAAVSAGTAILGALLGRKRLSSTTASKIGTAIRTAGSARKEDADVERAEELVARVEQELQDLNAALEQEITDLDTAFDAQAETLDEIVVRAKSTDIHVPVFGLAWMPWAADPHGRLRPAWPKQMGSV